MTLCLLHNNISKRRGRKGKKENKLGHLGLVGPLGAATQCQDRWVTTCSWSGGHQRLLKIGRRRPTQHLLVFSHLFLCNSANCVTSQRCWRGRARPFHLSHGVDFTYQLTRASSLSLNSATHPKISGDAFCVRFFFLDLIKGNNAFNQVYFSCWYQIVILLYSHNSDHLICLKICVYKQHDLKWLAELQSPHGPVCIVCWRYLI